MSGMKKPQTILDYLKHEAASFDEKPFCLLDAFVLGIASYFLFENTQEPHSSILDEALTLPYVNPQAQKVAQSKNPEHEVQWAWQETQTTLGNSVFTEQQLPLNNKQHTARTTLLEPVLVSAALESIPSDKLSNLAWFSKVAPSFKNALTQSKRFADLEVSDVACILEPQNFSQFAAACFHVPNGSLYLSFRGTDSTITGWEEDFALSVLNPTPSQFYALDYTYAMLNKWLDAARFVAKKPRHAQLPYCRLGGHSKGGNLAFYAALQCEPAFQQFITAAYNFDGPGVNPWNYEPSHLDAIRPRCVKLIPGNSVVGRIFDDIASPSIVKSNEFGLMQHMPFSWEITRSKPEQNATSDKEAAEAASSSTFAPSYQFVYQNANTLLSNTTQKGFSHWLVGLSTHDRIEFCAVLFGIIEYVADDNSIETLPGALLKKLPQVVQHVASLDSNTRQFMVQVIMGLLGELAQSLREGAGEQLQQTTQQATRVPAEQIQKAFDSLKALLPITPNSASHGTSEADASSCSSNA